RVQARPATHGSWPVRIPTASADLRRCLCPEATSINAPGALTAPRMASGRTAGQFPLMGDWPAFFVCAIAACCPMRATCLNQGPYRCGDQDEPREFRRDIVRY